jgi:biopolymer transport protein ExbB/TolQ
MNIAGSTQSTQPSPRSAFDLRAWAATKPLEIEGKNWVAIWAISFLLAMFVYSSTAFFTFRHVNSELLAATPKAVEFLNRAADCGTPLSVTQVAEDYAHVFGVQDENAIKSLNQALCLESENAAKKLQPNAVPALSLAIRLVYGEGQCKACEDECRNYWKDDLARHLAGTFVRSNKLTSGDPEACAKLRASKFVDYFRSWMFSNKPQPSGAPENAHRLMGVDACLSDETRETCTMVTRLLQAAVDNPSVRSARTWMNMFWGLERMLVYWLAFVVLFALIYHSLARQNLERQKDWLSTELDPKKTIDLTSLKKRLIKTFPEEEAHQATLESGSQNITPVLDLLNAAVNDHSGGGGHNDLDARVTANTHQITHGRVAIDLLITVFPVIGFVATLWGLITALSSANLIASSQGDEKNAAVLHVTAELSSCFATTLLALTLMTVFAIINVLQAKKEIQLVTEPQYHLLRALKSAKKG